MTAIQVDDLRFTYPGNDETPFVLALPHWQVERGERIAVFGASGAGKTTLLDLLAGIKVPDTGSIRVEGQDLGALSDDARRAHRIRTIGFVFQDAPLVPYLDAEANVLFPYRLNAALRLDDAARERARALLADLGLDAKRHRRPSQLSEGERRRVGIARALVTEPKLLLADEPTTGLDPDAADRVVELLERLSAERGLTLIVVTHDPAVRARFATQLEITS